MMQVFGWRAMAAVAINALIVTLLYRRSSRASSEGGARAPRAAAAGAAAARGAARRGRGLLAPPGALPGTASPLSRLRDGYPKFQDRIILREGLLVAFFLAGLVVLGGQQRWWLDRCCAAWTPTPSLRCHGTHRRDRQRRPHVPGLAGRRPEREFKYSLVAGAVRAAASPSSPTHPTRRLLHPSPQLPRRCYPPLGVFTAALVPRWWRSCSSTFSDASRPGGPT